MKKPLTPVLLTGALLLAGTVSTAYARDGEGYRVHDSKTLRMYPPARHAPWHAREGRHDRHRWEHRYRLHPYDHPAYRPHYHRTWRPAPPDRDEHWGLQLFYLD